MNYNGVKQGGTGGYKPPPTMPNTGGIRSAPPQAGPVRQAPIRSAPPVRQPAPVRQAPPQQGGPRQPPPPPANPWLGIGQPTPEVANPPGTAPPQAPPPSAWPSPIPGYVPPPQAAQPPQLIDQPIDTWQPTPGQLAPPRPPANPWGATLQPQPMPQSPPQQGGWAESDGTGQYGALMGQIYGNPSMGDAPPRQNEADPSRKWRTHQNNIRSQFAGNGLSGKSVASRVNLMRNQMGNRPLPQYGNGGRPQVATQNPGMATPGRSF